MPPTAHAERPVDLLAIGETMALVAPTTAERLENAESFHISVGGAESNVACHLAREGLATQWFSAVGDDALGRRVRREVAAHGVDVSNVRLSEAAPTGLYLKDPGHGVLYYRRGSAASRLEPADLDAVDFARVTITHLTGITLALSATCRALVHVAIDRAREVGSLVSFDVNHRPGLWQDDAAAVIAEAARASDIVFVGRDEAEILWGTRTADEIRSMFPYVPHVVVKDADIEAVDFGADRRTRVATPRVEVVEQVGAGDAFAAGWLRGYLAGKDARGRLMLGHATAALALASTQDVPSR